MFTGFRQVLVELGGVDAADVNVLQLSGVERLSMRGRSGASTCLLYLGNQEIDEMRYDTLDGNYIGIQYLYINSWTFPVALSRQ
jgi:hypothetical protein